MTNMVGAKFRYGVAAGVTAVLVLVTALQVAAFELPLGDKVQGSLDITLGYGAGWLATDSAGRNFQGLDFEGEGNPFNPSSKAMTTYPDKGDMYTNNFRAVAELSLNYENFGLVSSVSYNYDLEIMENNNGQISDNGALFDPDTGTSVNPADTGLAPNWNDGAKDETGNKFRLMDAYVYGEFEPGEVPVEIRVGRQVINWGEGLYYPGGVSTQVPLDYGRLTQPGTDLKEAYIPLAGVRAIVLATDNMTFDAYYFAESDHHNVPGVGTFFGDDIYGEGGVQEYANWWVDPGAKQPNVDAKDDGQYGVSTRFTIGDTEYGLYYSKYHAYRPIFEFVDHFKGLDPDLTGVGTALREVYVEDNDMFGASFSTTLGEWSFNGEIAYRPNEVLMTDFGMATPTWDPSNPGFFWNTGLAGVERDTVTASVHGVYVGGPGLFGFLGVDTTAILYQVNLERINGSTDNLAPNGLITSSKTGLTANPTKNAIGTSLEYDMTWLAIAPGLDMNLFLYGDYGVDGNSHFWGTSIEDAFWYSATLNFDYLAKISSNISYSGMDYNSDNYESVYEKQDRVTFSVDYKF